MIYSNDPCYRNPKRDGHCDHTTTRETTAGTLIVTKCCWCGREHTTQVNTPPHGPYGAAP